MITVGCFLLAGMSVWLGQNGVASDTACTSMGGSCRYTRTICTGYHLSRKCDGPTDRKCCVPAPGWYDDSKCKAIFGTCQMTSATCHGGTYRGGTLCDGPADRQCCAPPFVFNQQESESEDSGEEESEEEGEEEGEEEEEESNEGEEESREIEGLNAKCLLEGGRCFADNLQCPGHFKSNLCDGGTNTRCCIQGKCSAEQQRLACELFRSGNVVANQEHPSKEIDNAFPYNNLRDMCNGKLASMSGYYCEGNDCYAPNAKTCLSLTLLKYLKALIANGQTIQISELAGACHSCGSRHYSGLAVDLYPFASQRDFYVRKCNEMGGWGDDEGTHVHCQFYDGPHQNW